MPAWLRVSIFSWFFITLALLTWPWTEPFIEYGSLWMCCKCSGAGLLGDNPVRSK